MHIYWGLEHRLFLIVQAYMTIPVLAMDTPWQDNGKNMEISNMKLQSQ